MLHAHDICQHVPKLKLLVDLIGNMEACIIDRRKHASKSKTNNHAYASFYMTSLCMPDICQHRVLLMHAHAHAHDVSTAQHPLVISKKSIRWNYICRELSSITLCNRIG